MLRVPTRKKTLLVPELNHRWDCLERREGTASLEEAERSMRAWFMCSSNGGKGVYVEMIRPRGSCHSQGSHLLFRGERVQQPESVGRAG